MADELAVRVRLIDARLAQVEAKKTERAIGRIGGSARTAGKHAKESGKGFGAMGSAMGGLKMAAGITGIAGLAFGIKDVMSAGQKWQQQQAQLRSSLKSTGLHGANLTRTQDRLTKATEELSTHGGYSSPEQLKGITQFTRLTGDATRSIALNREATALARGTGMEYGEAVRAVSQIQTGNTGRLQKYLGIIQPVRDHVRALTADYKKQHPEALQQAQLLDKQATAAKANAQLMQKFGGATNAYGHTAAGAMSNARNTFELVTEQLGRYLLPVITDVFREITKLAQSILRNWPRIVATVKDAIKWFREHKAVTTALKVAVIGLVGGFVAMSIVTKVIRLFGALNAIMAANPVGLVIVAIAALAAGFVYLYKTNAKFRNGVQGVFRWLRTYVPAVVRVLVRIFGTSVRGLIQQFRGVVQVFRGIWQVIKGIFTLNAGLVWKGVKNIFGGGIKMVVGQLKTIYGPFIAVFKGVKDIVAGAFGWVVNRIIDGINLVVKAIDVVLSGYNDIPGVLRPTNKITPIAPLGHVKFASGGLVPGSGGGDVTPALLTPGEYVLRRQVVAQAGTAALDTFNARGAAAPAPADAPQAVALHHTVRLDSRVLAEGVTHYQLRRAALA